MVLKDQRLHLGPGLALKEQCGSQAANPPTDDDAVVGLTRVNDILGERIITAVTNGVAVAQHGKSVAIGRAIFPNPTVASKGIGL